MQKKQLVTLNTVGPRIWSQQAKSSRICRGGGADRVRAHVTFVPYVSTMMAETPAHVACASTAVQLTQLTSPPQP
jgi:hypothetical protein